MIFMISIHMHSDTFKPELFAGTSLMRNRTDALLIPTYFMRHWARLSDFFYGKNLFLFFSCYNLFESLHSSPTSKSLWVKDLLPPAPTLYVSWQIKAVHYTFARSIHQHHFIVNDSSNHEIANRGIGDFGFRAYVIVISLTVKLRERTRWVQNFYRYIFWRWCVQWLEPTCCWSTRRPRESVSLCVLHAILEPEVWYSCHYYTDRA